MRFVGVFTQRELENTKVKSMLESLERGGLKSHSIMALLERRIEFTVMVAECLGLTVAVAECLDSQSWLLNAWD